MSGANVRTAEALSQISQTGGDTETAHAIATESKAEAEKASVEAQRIVKESGETRKVAEQLKTSAVDMAEKLETTKALVDEKEGAANTNSLLANEALREANKAQSSSEDASKKVEQAKKELDDIMVLLLNIEDPGDSGYSLFHFNLANLQTSTYWTICLLGWTRLSGNTWRPTWRSASRSWRRRSKDR